MIGDVDWFARCVGAVADGEIEQNARVAKALINEGLAVLLIEPMGKRPVCPLSASQKARADKEVQKAAQERGDQNWDKKRHDCGVYHAMTEVKELTRVRIKALLSEGANLAIVPGLSSKRVLVVDVDTEEERREFLGLYGTPKGAEYVPMTVSSPGQMSTTVNGDTIHVHKNGGHYWFTIPDDVELPESPGKMTYCRCHGVRQPAGGCGNAWAVYWNSGYVIIPPSVREVAGEVRPYRQTGATEPAPEWLTDLIREEAVTSRREHGTEALSGRDDDPIDAWAAETSWNQLLTEDGYTQAGTDVCGCPTYTRPGSPVHTKSVTAHEVGCGGIYDTSRGHGPLHAWSDALRWDGRETVSKLTYYAHSRHEGDTSAAMRELGLTRLGREELEDFGEVDALEDDSSLDDFGDQPESKKVQD